jgi:hypothetical protein
MLPEEILARRLWRVGRAAAKRAGAPYEKNQRWADLFPAYRAGWFAIAVHIRRHWIQRQPREEFHQ